MRLTEQMGVGALTLLTNTFGLIIDYLLYNTLLHYSYYNLSCLLQRNHNSILNFLGLDWHALLAMRRLKSCRSLAHPNLYWGCVFISTEHK